MRDEYKALSDNNTWVLIPRPPNVNIARSMWLYKHKYNADGSLNRYKARLVANGRSQQQGIDCDETFSLVVKLATIRTVLSLAVSRQWPIHQSDVKNAFLHGHLTETVYMHQPPGFTDSAHSDYHIISLLHAEFAMTDLGPLNYFLGISVMHTTSGIFLSQTKYATEILEQAHMLNYNPCRTPIDTEKKLGPKGSPVTNPTLYRSLAGSLQYLTFTRLDLSYAVQQLCLYMHDPREPHLNAMKRVLRYLRETTDLGLQLLRSTTSQLITYSDADWAGCPATRRSTSGYCVFLGDNLLTWSSKRQDTLSRSSAEAEYRGVVNAVAKTSWIRNLLRELHTLLFTATLVYCDNVSAVYMSANPVQHQRTKHIEIDIHFVRDKVAAGHFVLSDYFIMAVEDDDSSRPKSVVGSSSDLNLSFGDPLYLHPNDTSGTPIWDMCNSVVVTWILNSLSYELFTSAIYAKTASEMWNDLKETYDKVDGSAQFDAMVSLSICTCDAAKHFDKHNQLIKLMQFLMCLDESYLATKSNFLIKEPLPNVKTAFSVISGEESHRNVTSVGTTKPAATAFVAKTFDNKKRFNNSFKGSGSNSNSNNIGPNPNLKCTNCNKIGHTVDRCFKLVGYPASYVKRNFNSKSVTSNNASVDVHSNGVSSNNATTSNSPVSLSSEQLARLMNLLNENGVSTTNANMAASAKFLTNVVDISNLGLTVGHPNGTQALITKIGDLKINNEVTLYDVLVVPEYNVSLLSVHKLSRDSKLFVGFDESNCYIQDLKANRTVGIGEQYNGLYLFDVDNACNIVSNNCIASSFVSKTLWHQRLGHHADQVLDVLKTTLNLDSHSNSDHLCDTCNKAKQTKEPFSLRGITFISLLSPDINQGNNDSEATSMDETNNTHPEGSVPNETDFINDLYENSKLNSDTEELPANTLRRSSRQTKLPSSLNDFIVEGKVQYGVERVVNYANLNHDNYCFVSALNKSVKPTCYEEAILDSNWIDAMNSEIEALNENHTWIITDLPLGRKAIGNKWIYKIKYKSSGDIDRYKARLVVKGCSKKEGVDFNETFSPIVKMSTVRCFIALFVINSWPLFQLDINNAFLYGDIDEDIYMTIPKGFASKDNNNKVCKLVKSFYRLKQAPRKWNEKLVTILKENGFVQSVNDHSLFTKSKDKKFIALLVYVDDIVVTGNCIDEIDEFKYCLELLKEYGLLGCKTVSTPMEPNYVLPYVPTKDDPLLDNITGYQKLLGKLIYLTHTRPDIAYSVHCLAQYMHSPLKSHLNYALNVLRYLKGAPGKGIRYKYSDCKNNLTGYSDAD
ncbi:ribonuclease H-like domain-containing protein [Tanacetum coccineum]